MKKFVYFILLFVAVLVPFIAFAEGEEEGDATLIETDNRAIVYFFHGDGCPHCAEAEEWFESIQEEYGSKFKLVAYEVWNDQANAQLMQQVSDLRGDNASGVPYIICGDKSWIGFSEDPYAEEIKAQIDAVYATDVAERYDVIAAVGGDVPVEKEKSVGSDILALVIILLVAGGVGYGIYRARKANE